MGDKPKSKVYTARSLKKPTGGFEEPHWALDPPKQFENTILEVFKTDGLILKRLYVGSHGAAFAFGRSETCQEVLEHPSISRFHATLVHCAAKEAGGEYERVSDDDKEIRGIVLCDLHSSHGTFLNKKQVPPGVAILVYENDTITFGGSSRKYRVKGMGIARPHREKTSEHSSSRKRALDGREEDSRNVKSKTKEEETVRVRHILVKHKDSRKPSSWKEEIVTRSKEEALALIEKFREEIVSGERTFEEIALKESHCSSNKRGGDLGFFGRGRMQPPFEKSAFDLEVHELSDPIFTNSGVHILVRLA